jgi:hypothetical protein
MAINLNHQLSSLTTSNQILQIDNSGNLILPSGSISQRNPVGGISATGSIRHNSDLCTIEYYDTAWHIIPQTVSDLEDFCFIDPVNVTKHIIYNITSCCFELADYVTNLTINNTLDVCGDLTVYGTNTNIKSTNLNISDINFTIASDVTDITQTDGAGFNISCANACFYYNQPNDTWNLNKNLVVPYVCGQISDISNHNTDALAEGSTNLYYTDARSRAALCGICDIIYDNTTGTICFDLDDHNTDGLAEGTCNLYYLDSRARNSLCGICDIIYDNTTGTICFDLDDHTTDALAEGTCNLYYLDSRARNSLCGGTGVTYCNTNGEISIGQDVSCTSNVTFCDVSVSGRLLSDDVTASNVYICGNLTVTGTTTTVNSTTVDIADKNITLACCAVNPTQADGAGLTVCGADACFYYNSVDDRWNLNKDLVVNCLYGQVSDISNHFTCDITECINLYYTDARSRAAICGICDIIYDNTTGTICFDLDDHNTDELTEGSTNLYYLDSRARNSLCGICDIIYDNTTGTICFDLDDHNTDELTEGSTNLYYLDCRVRDAVSACDCGGDGSFTYDNVSGIFTFTGPSPNEVRAHLCGGTGVTYCDTSGEISIGQDVSTTSCVNFDTVTANYGYYNTCLDITGKLVLRCLIDQGTPAQTDKYLVGYNASECLWKAMPFCCFYNVDDPIAYAIAFSN